MSSVILQAADSRLLCPNSYVLLHWGTLALNGSHRSVIAHAKFAEAREDRFLNVYAERMAGSEKWNAWGLGKIREELRKDLAFNGDLLLTPPQAIGRGLADGIYKGSA